MSRIFQALGGVLPASCLLDPHEDGGWAVGGVHPEAVVLPSTEEQVQGVLAQAREGGFGVVPLGSGSGLGCEAPSGPFVVLATSGLAGVEDYEPADLTVTVRAGTTLGALDKELRSKGQWLPVDPPFMSRRTVGGLVATGAPGSLGTAYGSPRDHVLGLTVVTGDGERLRLGGRVMKNVAGFDLVKLMVGSRGTLGVVTSASLRLFPVPATDRVLVLAGAHAGEVLDAARGVATAAVVPASAVLVTPAPDGVGGGHAVALVVRVQGAAAAVDTDARTLLSNRLTDAVVLEGADAQAALASVRDHAAAFAVVVRAFALPGLLPEVLDSVHDALPGAEVAADVMAGRVRVGVDRPEDADPSALLLLRARVEALGGTLVMERAPAALLAQVPAYGGTGSASALGAALRLRFDSQGVLSPGRFVL